MAVLLQAGQVDADVVVLGIRCDALPPLAERLVDEYPEVGVLAVDIDHARALIHRRCPSTEWIPDFTTADLAEAIRRAAAPRTT